MRQTIRAFVAVELPAQVKNALAELIEELHRADIRSIRLVRPEGIHLTLKFLGDVEEEQVEQVVTAVSNASRMHRAFGLELGSVGAFPSRNAPRVLWVGLRGDPEPLLRLQHGIEQALAPLGFAREDRPFSAHLTVARMGRGASPAERRKAADVLFSAEMPTGLRVEVNAVSLMRSELRPDGAVYQRLSNIPLAIDSETR